MSRWVQLPAHARDVADGRLPAGFRAAAAASGLKPSGGLDVGLLVCDAPGCTSAARFTRSGVLAAPVIVTAQQTEKTYRIGFLGGASHSGYELIVFLKARRHFP